MLSPGDLAITQRPCTAYPLSYQEAWRSSDTFLGGWRIEGGVAVLVLGVSETGSASYLEACVLHPSGRSGWVLTDVLEKA